ncbi:MAG: hypothetical protein K0U84_19040 [Actinomycetia bacterium]|nr:hypothetical protein [Actinomycetes bacterium]
MSGDQLECTLTIGAPYPTPLPAGAESAQWRLSEDGVELVLLLPHPTDGEVESIRAGRARFALVAGDHALILAYKFGQMAWSDAPWQACRQTDGTSGLADVPAGQLAVTVIVVDSATGIVRALRVTVWDSRFAGEVREAIRRQNLNRATERDGAAEIAAFYARHPTPRHLARAAGAETI